MSISEYIELKLTPQLRALKLKPRQLQLVVADIRTRLESIARHWHDHTFRRTILTIGYEEATFYDPKDVDLDIRAMVVVAVRNSLLEDLAASRAATKDLGLVKPVLKDSGMPAFTRGAIEHFQNPATRAWKAEAEQAPLKTDIFGSLPNTYPHAWHVLSQLANSPELECSFSASTAGVPEPAWKSTAGKPVQSQVSVVSSGIDPSFDQQLVAILNYIKEGEVPYFFADSFKGITRNPEKLFRIIDFVLGHGAGVVTHNYFLTPTYASRRVSLLRPFHFVDEAQKKFSEQSGLSHKHKDVMNEIKASFESE